MCFGTAVQPKEEYKGNLPYSICPAKNRYLVQGEGLFWKCGKSLDEAATRGSTAIRRVICTPHWVMNINIACVLVGENRPNTTPPETRIR